MEDNVKSIHERKHRVDVISAPFYQFLIAVDGTLIGYSLKQIENNQISYKLIPLGLAICCWMLSFFFGIMSIRKYINFRVAEVDRDVLRLRSAYENLTPTEKEETEKFMFKKIDDFGHIANWFIIYWWSLLYYMASD